jgi:hypothetical protein
MTRHTEINSIINRSLTSIHVNSTLEPNGLSRDDGKHPDVMTLVPWIKGQPLVWDVIIVDTLADSYDSKVPVSHKRNLTPLDHFHTNIYIIVCLHLRLYCGVDVTIMK